MPRMQKRIICAWVDWPETLMPLASVGLSSSQSKTRRNVPAGSFVLTHVLVSKAETTLGDML